MPLLVLSNRVRVSKTHRVAVTTHLHLVSQLNNTRAKCNKVKVRAIHMDIPMLPTISSIPNTVRLTSIK